MIEASRIEAVSSVSVWVIPDDPAILPFEVIAVRDALVVGPLDRGRIGAEDATEVLSAKNVSRIRHWVAYLRAYHPNYSERRKFLEGYGGIP